MELATNYTAVMGESGSPSGATGDGPAGLMVFVFDHWYGVFMAPSPGRVFTVIRYQKVPSVSVSLCWYCSSTYFSSKTPAIYLHNQREPLRHHH